MLQRRDNAFSKGVQDHITMWTKFEEKGGIQINFWAFSPVTKTFGITSRMSVTLSIEKYRSKDEKKL